MTPSFAQADDAALAAYSRAHDSGSAHELALNIAVSIWFSRCPWIDGQAARRRVSRLLAARAAGGTA